ncbi:gamma-glutamyltransferase [Gilliamella sp. ESL0443]|uniref:gamma-glutamyltransferase n=1 Tax=Gilliamella sp. ESL0443 TaxID=2704655 RepID=UPI001CE6DDDF|nr:gamma-glutamyltransferase [Gilliamella sp. ESL0443]QYN43159.1 gamma-glutamyltransferase [Gilliamella sp. ESL0443]
MRKRYPILISLLLISHLSGAADIPLSNTGKYCDTPSRCLNPITTNVMVTSPNYLATQAGIDILRKGGNAVDAAIAVASTLAVVYPQMNTIGGDNFWLIYNAKTKELKGLNASGRSGSLATIDYYKNQGFHKIPSRGYLAANTVPGVVSGWDEAYQYASKNMNNALPWHTLFASAIDYAENGFSVSPSLNYWSTVNIDPKDKEFRELQRFSEFKKVFLKNNGQAYQIGEILKQPDLANTLKIIANKGAKEFYQGDIAKNIVNDLQSHGGVLTLDDFAKHRATWVAPIHVNYRQYTAYNLPPNTQGMASLEILNILNNFDIKSLGEGSADYYHLIIEATKQAFADRDKYLTDPDFNQIPLDLLLSTQHGQQQAKQIDMQKARVEIKPLDPKGDTVWFGVVDAEGNAVSIIQSIYHDFGSGIVAKDTGILLQNRGSFFSLDPNHINRLEPNKRTFHTLNPAMLLKDNKPYLVYGTMGGEGQPQTQAAIVTRIVDFGMTPQDAINAPRWLHGRTWGASSNNLKVEGRIPNDVIHSLKLRGHDVQIVDDYTDTMGHAGAILIDANHHLLMGATDPRGDGLVAGY